MDFHLEELLLELETFQNRPRARGEHGHGLLERWWCGPGAPPQVALRERPELMVVLTTFGRPEGARRVLGGLAGALRRAGIGERTALLVLHDGCGQDYTGARAAALATAPTSLWLDAREHFGKPGFWRVHQTALLAARIWRPELALYLQDDVEFDPDLLERALELWAATASDPLRRVLYLFSSRDDEERGRWVRFQRREAPGCRLTNWFDLQAFLVDREFFELLGHRMVPIHPNRWRRQPASSSGVGRQLTRRLFGRAHVYQAWPPLVVHGELPSLMNPEARRLRPLDNRADFVRSGPPRAARPEALAP